MSGNDKISRRGFLSVLTAGPLAAGGLVLLGGSCGGGQPVTVERGGLVLDGRIYPLYSGTVHYWQHERRLWPLLLDQLSRMGLLTLCVDIPWSVHERGRDSFDFGSGTPELALTAFLDLAGERGMKVLARPGPRQGPEIRGRGIPYRVLFDTRAPARDSLGDIEVEYCANCQHPVPSCFSEFFFEETGIWFDRVAPLLSNRLHTRGGPVIGIQVDHHNDYSGRLRYPYSLDYHPSAIRSYRNWLARKYGNIETLNRIYEDSCTSFETVEPPRDFLAENLTELPRYLDWVRFRMDGVTSALNRLAGMLEERGLSGVPMFGLLPPAFRAPNVSPGTNSPGGLQFHGMESHSSPEDYPRERRLVRAAAGFGPFPFRAGVPLGGPVNSRNVPPDADQVEFMALSAAMHGGRGFNFQFAVERDGWSGSPLTRDCRVRDEYFQVVQRFSSFLRESRFHRYRKVSGLLLLYNRGLDCLAASQERRRDALSLALGGEVFNETVDLGFRSSPVACSIWLDQISEMMRGVGFDWDCADTGVPFDRLAEYTSAIMPVGDFFDEEELGSLGRYLDNGGVLVFGPGKPSLDQDMHPSGKVANFFSGALSPDEFLSPTMQRERLSRKLIHMESSHQVGRLINSLGFSPVFTRSNVAIDLALHENPEGDRLLFTANPTARSLRGDIFFQGRFLIGRWGDTRLHALEGKMTVELEPCSINIWEVRRDGS